MRRGNSTGTIYKLSGKRRKPWVARMTVGFDENGKQLRQTVGTFATKREAQVALEAACNASAPRTSMTLKQAWTEWTAQFSGSHVTIASYKSAYKNLLEVENLEINSLSLDLLQPIVDGVSNGTAKIVKNVLHNLIEYAFSRDCCEASRLSMLKFLKLPPKTVKRDRGIFTDNEIMELFEQNAVGALILMFTGLRMEEMIALEPSDINLDEQYIQVRKSKTEAGIREVPIPDGLIPYFEQYIGSGLCKTRHTFNKRHWFPYKVLEGRVRHECRHTYVTLLTIGGVDQRIVKSIVGHASSVTEDVYTHIPMNRKIEEVNRVFSRFFISDADRHEHFMTLPA